MTGAAGGFGPYPCTWSCGRLEPVHFATYVQIGRDGHMRPVETLHQFIGSIQAWSCSVLRVTKIQGAEDMRHEAAVAVALQKQWREQRP